MGPGIMQTVTMLSRGRHCTGMREYAIRDMHLSSVGICSVGVGASVANYTMGHKKGANLFFSVTSSKINGF